MRRHARRAVLAAAAWLCCAGGARAHAPLARAVALAPDGGGVAVRMPGFGLLVRADETAPFAYACDALLGIEPTETTTPLVYRGDGSLLIGTQGGLRIVTGDGCPAAASSADLAGVPIAALAVHPDDPNLVYAVTAEAGAAIHRSSDGGEHWQLRSRIVLGEPVSALILRPGDPDAVYLSRPSGERSSILVSEDAGATFATFEQERALALLHVESTPSPRLLAMARDRESRTVAIFRAAQPEGPWLELVRVNFFGGFAIDPNGVIWVGDEGGSVFRSSDGGDSWQDVQPDAAVACLVHGRGALWACTPGTTQQRALARLADADARADFEDVTAFADVDALVDCGPALAVEQTCASAWNEWRVDVQSSPSAPAAGTDAGQVAGTDAGQAPGTDAGQAFADAEMPAETPAAAPVGGPAREAAACDVASRVAGTPRGRSVLLPLLAWLVLARRRHFRSAPVALDSNACRPHARLDRRSRRLPCRATSS